MKKSAASAPPTIDAYIAAQPAEVRPILQKVRATIAKAAPAATEAIKYQIPTFVLHGNLVHFGAVKHHLGFYATPTGHIQFAKELSAYESGKGSVQFPFAKPIPYALIAKIVKYRAKENTAKAPTPPNKTRRPAPHEVDASRWRNDKQIAIVGKSSRLRIGRQHPTQSSYKHAPGTSNIA